MGFLDSVKKAVESQQDSMARSYRNYERQGQKMAASSDPETARKGRMMVEKSQAALESYDKILKVREANKYREY